MTDVLRSERLHAVLLAFYEKHSPGDVSKVDGIVKKALADEEGLIGKLLAKYNVQRDTFDALRKNVLDARLKAIITAFYQKYNPGDIAKVDAILAKQPEEDALFPKLVAKYNVSETDFAAIRAVASQTATSSSKEMNDDDFRKVVTAFYTKYNPDDVAKVDGILAKKPDHETLFHKLMTKYKVSETDFGVLKNEALSAANTTVSSDTLSTEEFRAVLTAFYQKYNAAEIAKVDPIVTKRPNPDDIFQRLCAKYEVSALQFAALKAAALSHDSESSSTDGNDRLRKILTLFYQKYNATDIGKVDALVAKNPDEDALFAKLCQKYDVSNAEFAALKTQSLSGEENSGESASLPRVESQGGSPSDAETRMTTVLTAVLEKYAATEVPKISAFVAKGIPEEQLYAKLAAKIGVDVSIFLKLAAKHKAATKSATSTPPSETQAVVVSGKDRAKIVAFYERFAPGKVGQVDKALKIDISEDELLKHLAEKFSVSDADLVDFQTRYPASSSPTLQVGDNGSPATDALSASPEKAGESAEGPTAVASEAEKAVEDAKVAAREKAAAEAQAAENAKAVAEAANAAAAAAAEKARLFEEREEKERLAKEKAEAAEERKRETECQRQIAAVLNSETAIRDRIEQVDEAAAFAILAKDAATNVRRLQHAMDRAMNSARSIVQTADAYFDVDRLRSAAAAAAHGRMRPRPYNGSPFSAANATAARIAIPPLTSRTMAAYTSGTQVQRTAPRGGGAPRAKTPPNSRGSTSTNRRDTSEATAEATTADSAAGVRRSRPNGGTTVPNGVLAKRLRGAQEEIAALRSDLKIIVDNRDAIAHEADALSFEVEECRRAADEARGALAARDAALDELRRRTAALDDRDAAVRAREVAVAAAHFAAERFGSASPPQQDSLALAAGPHGGGAAYYAHLVQVEAALAAAQRALAVRDGDIAGREAAAEEREAIIKQRLIDVEGREVAVEARERHVETELAARAAALEQAQSTAAAELRRLTEAEAVLVTRQQTAAEREAAAAAASEKAVHQQKHVDEERELCRQLSEDLLQREGAVRAVEQGLNAARAELHKLEEDVAAKAKSALADQAALRRWAEDLNQRQRHMDAAAAVSARKGSVPAAGVSPTASSRRSAAPLATGR